MKGFTPRSSVTSYGAGNSQIADAEGSYYIEGNLSATLIFGQANELWEGNVAHVIVMATGTSGAKLKLVDSNSASALTNKRYIEIGLGSAAGNSLTGFAYPVNFRFREGLVAEVTGDTSGAARILILVPFLQKSLVPATMP
ncbi:MAG: hypothetical protein GXP62_04045 [Oligoflexia bacterium]|nr:hypothetical protein [Oligoflexia bacterium]